MVSACGVSAKRGLSSRHPPVNRITTLRTANIVIVHHNVPEYDNEYLFLFKYNRQHHLHDNRLAFSDCYVMIIRDLVVTMGTPNRQSAFILLSRVISG